MEYIRQYVVRLKQSEINHNAGKSLYVELIKKCSYLKRKDKRSIIEVYNVRRYSSYPQVFKVNLPNIPDITN